MSVNFLDYIGDIEDPAFPGWFSIGLTRFC